MVRENVCDHLELLFSCKVSRYIGCDHLELSITGQEEANRGRKTVEMVGVGGGGGDKHNYGVVTDDDEDSSGEEDWEEIEQ